MEKISKNFKHYKPFGIILALLIGLFLLESSHGALPDPPSDLVAQAISKNQVKLSWKDNAKNERGFTIERTIGTGVYSQIFKTRANEVVFIDTLLKSDLICKYRVYAYNDSGNSIYSNTVSATMAPPAAPTNLISQLVSSTQINLTWKDNATNETGFLIQRVTDTVSDTFFSTGPNETAYADKGLSRNTMYQYRILAKNGAGISESSNTVVVATTIPSAPSNLTARTISSTQINLSWKDNSTNETGFLVQMGTGTGEVPFYTIFTTASNSTSYSNTELSGNTTYQFRVLAKNGIGNSPSSDKVVAVTTIPAAPTGLVAKTISPTQISVSWRDNSTDETGFLVQRGTGSGGVIFSTIFTTVPNVNSYKDTGLTPGTTYQYRIISKNGVGNSWGSNSISAATMDKPLSNFQKIIASINKKDYLKSESNNAFVTIAHYSISTCIGTYYLSPNKKHSEKKTVSMIGAETGKRFLLKNRFSIFAPASFSYGIFKVDVSEPLPISDGTSVNVELIKKYYQLGITPQMHYSVPISEKRSFYLAAGGGVNYVLFTEEEHLINDPERYVKDKYLENGKTISMSLDLATGIDLMITKKQGLSLSYQFKLWNPISYLTSRDLFPLRAVRYKETFLTHAIGINVLLRR